MEVSKKMLSPYVFPGIRPADLPVMVLSKKYRSKVGITEEQVMEIIANECQVTVESIISLSRVREITDARHIYCAAVRMRLNMTLVSIGKKISNRDHTTVRHGILKFMERYSCEESYKEISDRIFSKIGVSYNGKRLIK